MTNQSKNRKFLATTLTATMVAAAVAPVAGVAAAENVFPDVPADHAYAGVIADMAKAGIVAGGTDGNFNLGGKITRAEAAQMVAGLLDLKTGAHKNETKFEDVKSDVWYTGAINSLVAEGVIAGISEKVFEPGANITRGQLAQLLVVAYGLEDVDVTDVKLPFTDVDEDAWYTKPIKQLYSEGLIDGQTANTFGPKADMKRGDFAWLAANVDYAKGDKLPKPTPEVTEGITSVKAINDTTVEVEFGTAIDKDFVREAELSGKYFVIYTEGESVQSARAIQSNTINFSTNGKSAEFTVGSNIESGKKYYVALLNGEDNRVADVVHSYGPTELKAAAQTPEFEVSAVADKIYVKYNAKMKDSARTVANYTVFDEGGQDLGLLTDFLATGTTEGKWVNLNDKNEVEFKLAKDSKKHLLAGKTYKLLVDKSVKTDDNKTLSDTNRTVTVKTPSVDAASPSAKVARVTSTTTIDLIFDQDITGFGTSSDTVQLNPAQLDLRTSTGKTVDVDDIEAKVTGDNKVTVTLKGNSTELDRGTSYKVNLPANIVRNGIFQNATNKATTDLEAKAQENVSIQSMAAKIVANAKNTGQADLILTFDQVPVIDDKLANAIQLFDGRDEYKLPNNSANLIKVDGSDTTGKTLIIEDVTQFTKGSADVFTVRGDKSYDVEIKAGNVKTDAFGQDITQATNKNKLTAATQGVSVEKPVVDEVTLLSADKMELTFKEELAGTIEASDLEVMAFVPNRSDLYTEVAPEWVSGSGYYDVEVSGKSVVITMKNGVKLPTSFDKANVVIEADAFTNKSGTVGNEKIVVSTHGTVLPATVDQDDLTDKAAPIIIQVDATSGDSAKVTYSEAVEMEGDSADLASLFKAVGEDTGTGITYATGAVDNSGSKPTHTEATITFKELVWKKSTDLSKVTLSYTRGNTYFLQDAEGNKMVTTTVKGLTNKTDALQ